VCIPAYNRQQFLKPLLDSVLAQDFTDYEIVICEDKSPQREEIRQVLQTNYAGDARIKAFYNEVNLGYDANFRELLTRASGRYCFFMGNDDLMAAGALSRVARAVTAYDNVGLILRSYDWFATDPLRPEQTVRYFDEDRIFSPGPQTIATAYRRCGVLSGYVIHREKAMSFATNEFDGYLYYQMYLAACVLTEMRAYYIHDVLTHSRSTEAPDFGNSSREKKVFTPGRYTPEARIHMVTGMVKIAGAVDERTGVRFAHSVRQDIANYVYPYISDQLNLPPPAYLKLYHALGALGLKKHRMFTVHFLLGYLLKERGYNVVTKFIRTRLGRSPQIGDVYAGEKA